MPRAFRRSLCRALFSSIILSLLLLEVNSAWAAKNVILMIADGGGYNQWLAASMYQGAIGKQVYDQPGWFHTSCTTYPLNLSHNPTGNLQQDPALVYDSVKAWDATPLNNDGKQNSFVGYKYLTDTPTDSAAAATVLASGQKTYNNSINWTNDDRPMRGETIAEISKAAGKSVGVVTSVPLSHATPAGLGGAHNISRNNYPQIANEMIDAPWLDVIMGAGHPAFDDNGQPREPSKEDDYKYVGGKETWLALKDGKRNRKLLESKADFESLISGPTPPKVIGVAQVASTLQEKRQRVALDRKPSGKTPFAAEMNQNVPTLATMALGALNCLDENPNGFFLMIEGGAVDWANHANEQDRVIEEQIDYVKAVEAVVAWIESHGGWDDTLLILTADHESGFLWGPDSKKTAFQPLEDHGSGKLPGMAYNSNGHSNSLVPLYARGPGSERFARLTKGHDSSAAKVWSCSGDYVDDSDVFGVMKAETSPH